MTRGLQPPWWRARRSGWQSSLRRKQRQQRRRRSQWRRLHRKPLHLGRRRQAQQTALPGRSTRAKKTRRRRLIQPAPSRATSPANTSTTCRVSATTARPSLMKAKANAGSAHRRKRRRLGGGQRNVNNCSDFSAASQKLHFALLDPFTAMIALHVHLLASQYCFLPKTTKLHPGRVGGSSSSSLDNTLNVRIVNGEGSRESRTVLGIKLVTE